MDVTLGLCAWFLTPLLLVNATLVSAAEYQWTEVIDSPSPPARRSHAMALDPVTNEIVLFGGFANGSHLGDTWTFSTETKQWHQVESAESPSPRAAAMLVYEPLHERLILFGGFGFGHSVVTNDTWAFDTRSNSWADLKAENPPSERASYGLAVDSKRGLIVLFGGFTERGYFNDIWEYDPEENAWHEIKTEGGVPLARGAMGFVYDEGNDVFVMYGGFSENGFFGDTWTFDPKTNSWKEMSPEDHPPPVRTRMVYSDKVNQSIFFGGDVIYPETAEAAVEPYNSVWAYDYQRNTWQELIPQPSNGSPSKRSLNGIVFDPVSLSIVIFGGTDTLIDDQNFVGREFGDTWILALASEPSPIGTLGPGDDASFLSSIGVIILVGAAGGAIAAAAFIVRNRRKQA